MRNGNTRNLSNGRASSKSDNVFVADFETTTDPDDCRVWAWGLTRIFDEMEVVEVGNSIESFIDRMGEMASVCYFHNLGFDGKFIIDWLMNNGFTHVDSNQKIKPFQFKTCISNAGQFYSITVQWSKSKKTEFRDSLKKLPMTVKRIAGAFRLEILKGEIDYDAPRPVGHVLTDEEIAYIKNDVLIVAKALRIQLMAGMTKLTVGADSMAEYKKLFGTAFNTCFPVLSESMDSEIRRAYRGGWTYADPRFRGVVQRRPIRVYDVNSLYPSVMYDRLLPYGDPVWVNGYPEPTDDYPLYITSITFTAKLKPDHVPCIQIKNHRFIQSAEYVSEIDEPLTITCTNVDLALWKDHYDMDIISYDGAWMFKGMVGAFTEYIDKWMNVKATTQGGVREIAKLHLNSLYGKFATNPDVTPKIPILGDDNIIHFVKGPEETRNPVYTAMGVFITAYARDVTIRAAQANYDIFAYADTDSLHLLTDRDPDNLNIDPTALGAWKFEGAFEAGLYVRAKCYTEKHPEGVCTCCPVHEKPCTCAWDVHARACGYETHIAGLPASIASQVTFDDFWDGHEFFGKLVPRAVPGGVVLQKTSWKLSDPSLDTPSVATATLIA